MPVIGDLRIDALSRAVSRRESIAPVSYSSPVIGPGQSFDIGRLRVACATAVSTVTSVASRFIATAALSGILASSLDRPPRRTGDPIGRHGALSFRDTCIVTHDVLDGGPHWTDPPNLRFNCLHPEREWHRNEDDPTFRRRSEFNDTAALRDATQLRQEVLDTQWEGASHSSRGIRPIFRPLALWTGGHVYIYIR